MALTFTPYRLYGLRGSFRTEYRISEGFAEIRKLRLAGWRVVQRIPLEGISTKIEGTNSQKLLGRGTIKITSSSGETMLWENMQNTKAVQDALYNWKTLDVPKPKEISDSKIKAAKKTHQTDFGAYQDGGITPEDTKVETPIGTFICHHDGTFTDVTNKLMWIQAPWGMTFDGKKFKGEFIPLNWDDATKLFGYNGTLPKLAGLGKKAIKEFGSREYKRGSCTINFSDYSDWRLPTAEELLNLCLYYDKEIHGESANGESNNYRWLSEKSRELWDTLFPALANRLFSYWSANDKGGDEAWLFDDNGSRTLGDYYKHLEHPILFVRTL